MYDVKCVAPVEQEIKAVIHEGKAKESLVESEMHLHNLLVNINDEVQVLLGIVLGDKERGVNLLPDEPDCMKSNVFINRENARIVLENLRKLKEAF